MNRLQSISNRTRREARWDTNGEGSRGGVVIGHTSTGKPIYKHNRAPGVSETTKSNFELLRQKHKELHKKFTTKDHIESAQLHEQLAKNAMKKVRNAEPGASSKNADLGDNLKHESLRDQHLKSIGAKSMTHLNKAIKVGAIK